jgi:hypothetical protein
MIWAVDIAAFAGLGTAISCSERVPDAGLGSSFCREGFAPGLGPGWPDRD